MEIHPLIVKISFCSERMMVYLKESLILILFIPHYAMCFSFQLASFNGILKLPTTYQRIRMHKQITMTRMANSFPWHNIFAIVFTFIPHIWIPIISFLLANSFRSMFVNLGLSQSRSVFLSLGSCRMTLG